MKVPRTSKVSGIHRTRSPDHEWSRVPGWQNSPYRRKSELSQQILSELDGSSAVLVLIVSTNPLTDIALQHDRAGKRGQVRRNNIHAIRWKVIKRTESECQIEACVFFGDPFHTVVAHFEVVGRVVSPLERLAQESRLLGESRVKFVAHRPVRTVAQKFKFDR